MQLNVQEHVVSGGPPQVGPQKPMHLDSQGNMVLMAEEYHADMSAIPINALEFLRLKLTQLTHSLNMMHALLLKPVLPPWPNLHAQFNVILKQLMSLSETLAHYRDILARTVVYPLPSFPLITQGASLRSLLRKKATPEVEEWIANARTLAQESGVQVTADEEFSAFAAATVEEELKKHRWNGFLTREQVERGERDPGIKLKQTPQQQNRTASGAPFRGLPTANNGPGQPRLGSLGPPSQRTYEDGGWTIERVIDFMAAGPPEIPKT
ncbi:uncharacterized protein SAPINGB_P001908 [Magnusiomyces paraingens]|uniref:Mediator of RNA polymerase II transcription subunit 8 n=1 Tax=Magnusiomyces paraingens TaxID=2606893 RepID=A0A5E8BC97_9ASCO|nr:uncharacterized protein SAPINGB_P001908 [Saprochaete ingens]VVT48700.1 unnamed protein product [Saprochaete ingens]